MNDHEEYFRISRNGHVHILNNRIPFRWKEMIIFTTASFIFLILMFGWFVGLFIAILTLICYTLYRFASWIYYTELKIDKKLEI
ncbi:hypothetical protein INR76_05850 [Marixanthomonas sp. SCSIO 43207]|uniref:hypothetical protein n=1 Tax=Marixanthomonas sp. SCSIO 43207 TaxID=2779360 RepID=UPI001CA9DF17|nr:hypothetical protein [Marixanthomonas sp. SCSIO 43207]UAB82282.1 hypothetical protein INR76_05850 [Marixanthomonas sp. SCSIO 43207]